MLKIIWSKLHLTCTVTFYLFTGSHTGHIQVIGGSGDVTKGGGGSGGRIALFHSRHVTIPHYRGYFDSFGGKPGTYAEAGASGTVYVEDGERSYRWVNMTFIYHIKQAAGV